MPVLGANEETLPLASSYLFWTIGIGAVPTVLNPALAHLIRTEGYSKQASFDVAFGNIAVAGMGIAKKINMLAFAVAQGITQGTLPLIGYNFTSGNRKRMLAAIRTLFLFSLVVSITISVLLYTNASGVTRLFINDHETVQYGRTFLHIICSACPMTTMTFFALTVFQATGQKRQPILLSMLRKGTIDVPFMCLFSHIFGINGVAWATPVAEITSLIVSATLVIPYIRKLSN